MLVISRIFSIRVSVVSVALRLSLNLSAINWKAHMSDSIMHFSPFPLPKKCKTLIEGSMEHLFIHWHPEYSDRLSEYNILLDEDT